MEPRAHSMLVPSPLKEDPEQRDGLFLANALSDFV